MADGTEILRYGPFAAHLWALEARQGYKMTVSAADAPLSWSAVARRWQEDGEFRELFARLLATVPFRAFFWETVPVAAHSRSRSFECVVIDSPALAGVQPDKSPFAPRFVDADSHGICTFSNLGGDARLVVPAPEASAVAYPHLATFVRQAPRWQVHALWAATGRCLESWWELDRAPCWVSTSGLGVFWVHVRLDSRPKYYVYAPYRSPS